MLLFFADAHGDFTELLDIAGQYTPSSIEGIFLLGDQTPQRPLTEELAPLGAELIAKTWFLLGNHDVDTPAFLENHFCLWSRHLHQQTITVDGLRIRGLSGAFDEAIWLPPAPPHWPNRHACAEYHSHDAQANKEQLPRGHWAAIFPEDIPATPAEEPVDILLTHDAPDTHPRGFAQLTQAARNNGAALVLHGHLHEDYQAPLPWGGRVYGLDKQQIFFMTPEMWSKLRQLDRGGSF
ncbi:metallophosphoesterase family protein [Desulfohalobium retbaense]|uniref:metallophosphoesterase family protein n=1 Tax=Desulfohalobium retbaense TaxID=45663 RepID=UPI000319CCB0|nr:metallophosphoesterase [Desulfohalobium retbaense]